MNKGDDILISNTCAFTTRKQLFFRLLSIFIVENDKVQLKIWNITFVMLKFEKKSKNEVIKWVIGRREKWFSRDEKDTMSVAHDQKSTCMGPHYILF